MEPIFCVYTISLDRFCFRTFTSTITPRYMVFFAIARRKAAQNMMKRIAKGFTESSSDEEADFAELDLPSEPEPDLEPDLDADELSDTENVESTGEVSSFESETPKEGDGDADGDVDMKGVYTRYFVCLESTGADLQVR